MNFKKGRNRFVIVFPSIGLAVKFPIVHFLKAAKIFIADVAHLRFKKILRQMRPSTDNNCVFGYRNILFEGILVNWREFMFSLRIKNPFVQPTHFSFLGLINVQRSDETCTMDGIDFTIQIRRITDNNVWADPRF